MAKPWRRVQFDRDVRLSSRVSSDGKTETQRLPGSVSNTATFQHK